jgi:hypothetical protein
VVRKAVEGEWGGGEAGWRGDIAHCTVGSTPGGMGLRRHNLNVRERVCRDRQPYWTLNGVDDGFHDPQVSGG